MNSRKRIPRKGKNRRRRPPIQRSIVSKYLVPPRIRMHLQYSVRAQMQSAVLDYQNVVYCPTDVMNVSMGGPANDIPGLTSLIAQYRFFRVNRFRVYTDFSSYETGPITCYLIPGNGDPGVNTNRWPGFLSNSACKRVLVAQVGGDNARRLSLPWTSIAQFGGSADVKTADYYSGSTTGTLPPVNNMFLVVGCVNDNIGSTLSNGIIARSTFVLDVEFFEQKVPDN